MAYDPSFAAGPGQMMPVPPGFGTPVPMSTQNDQTSSIVGLIYYRDQKDATEALKGHIDDIDDVIVTDSTTGNLFAAVKEIRDATVDAFEDVHKALNAGVSQALITSLLENQGGGNSALAVALILR